jgi:uncharacterized membrane protein YozB (DUF420 family)
MERYEPDEKLRLFLYLIPVFGAIPAIWTLTRTNANPHHKQVSRTSLTLALAWLVFYLFCWQGSNWMGEIGSIRLLYSSALVTTGYFGANFWLILRMLRGRSINILNLYSESGKDV